MNKLDQEKTKTGKGALIFFNVLFLLLICLAFFGLYKIFNQASVPKLNPVDKADMGIDHFGSYAYANGQDPLAQEREEEPRESNRIQGFTVENEVRTKEYMEKIIGQFDTEEEEWEEEILPDSDDRLITTEDVDGAVDRFEGFIPASSNVPQMIINEILARHGYWFKNKEIRDYFLDKDWYQGRDDYEEDMDKVMARLSDLEKKNIDFIVKNYR